MKSLTQVELTLLVEHLQAHLLGAQLQEVLANDRGLALGFQAETRYWLILDLLPATPMMVLFENHCPFRKAAKTKPVALFLNSHGKNLLLRSIEVKHEFGRLVGLKLASKDDEKLCEIEVRLIPKQTNLIVKAEGKSISWEKPLHLSPPPVADMPEPRSLSALQDEWLQSQKSGQRPSQDPVAQFEKQRLRDIDKKTRALVDIQKQIDNQDSLLWVQVGQELKNRGQLTISEELRNFLNPKESLSWNIENCFVKAKQLEGKKEGARQRKELLLKEISDLERKKYSPVTKKPGLSDLMEKIEARGRKLPLPSGAIAYCGRSASDNLSLLRQAKAWDYWMHLRDYPGAHAILHRHRDQEIPEKEIQQVAEWVAKESLSSKSLQNGQKLAVVIVECRFVRPIKGDKLGRVSYHSEKTLSFTLRHD